MKNKPSESDLLSVIRKLQPNAYGLSVYDELTARDFGVSLGRIYLEMYRLETEGKIRSYLGDPTPARGYRPKRFWEIAE